ncbi:MAG: AAA family ATPase, partial [Polyangiaceae bacterium]|nr:AAA family ATPase [Polyangiaceae bacterium]
MQLDKYAPDAKSLVSGAQSLADDRKHALVEPVHFLYRAVDRDRGVAEVFKRSGAAPTDVLTEAELALARIAKSSGGLAYLSEAMLEFLKRAEKEAAGSAVQVEHLLNALSQEIRGAAGAVIQSFGIGPGSFRPHLSALKTTPRDNVSSSSGSDARGYTYDLVDKAKKGELETVIGRDTEVRLLLQILERRSKNHPLLVGEHGVGKSTIVLALASRIAAGDVPSNLSKLALLELETGSLIAGAKLRGEVEERLKNVLTSVRAADGKTTDAILYISQLDSLMGQGAVGAGIGELLKPYLARGEVRVLATTTPDGIRKIQEKDPGLLRHFTTLSIEPSTTDQTVEILRGVATRYEKHHGVQIGDPAITTAVRLAKRYLQDRALPECAVDLLDESAARKRVEIDGVPAHIDQAIRRLQSLTAQRHALSDDQDAMSTKARGRIDAEIAKLEPSVTEMRSKLESRKGALAARNNLQNEHSRLEEELKAARAKQDFARLGELEHVTLPDLKRRLDTAETALAGVGGNITNNIVTEEDVALVLGDWTGIPVSKMMESESDKLLNMEDRLAKRVVGQDEAVRAISKATRRGRVGLRDPGKPIGSFLFLGPSGVGKTELAKALAEFLFDDEQAMTRLDMSEFMEKHMAQRLVGAPPGYVDSDQGGFLTEAVRRRPYSVLLFDEVEKAHADVFNLLLQVLDDGRLTDGRGRTADFSNTVVIMTSNIGSKRILDTDAKMFESEEGKDALKDVLLDELKNFLRPEFLNRIDDIVVFRPLSKIDLRSIVDIQLRRLEKLLVDRELK